MRLPRPLVEMTAAHFLVDNYASMLGAFLPFLHRELNLSLFEAGLLGGVLAFSSSLLQPLFGWLSDRFPYRLFSALGPGFAGIFIAAMGIAPSFEVLLLMVLLGGLGIASFHPQGAASTLEGSVRHHGFILSFFLAGGLIGYALGPICITTVIVLIGLDRSYWAALPGILMTAYLLACGPSPHKRDTAVSRPAIRTLLRVNVVPLLQHYWMVVLRSAIQIVFVSFLPLYYTSRGRTEMEASQYLTLFLLAGGIAGFAGGILADRIGGRAIVALSFSACFPLLFGAILTEGILSVVLCTLGGGFLMLPVAVNVAMAQRLVPQGASTVSALMMGFAWGTAGLIVPLAGSASDAFGLHVTLLAVVFLAIPGFFIALALRSDSIV